MEGVDDGNKKDEVFVEVPSSKLNGDFFSGSVVNLSCKSLAEYQIKLLSKGLKFSPTPSDIDKNQLKLDIEEFKKKMKLKWYFRDNNNNDSSSSSNYANTNNPPFYIKSGWNPSRTDPILESYLSLLKKETFSIVPEGRNCSNLSIGERQALHELRSDKNIVIKEADKGSAMVVF